MPFFDRFWWFNPADIVTQRSGVPLNMREVG
jgi:hypothetical protein